MNMSAWVEITVDGIKDRKLADLVDALRTAALGENQPDPTPNIIAVVTERIRTEVGSCASNTLDPNPSKIPASLLAIGVRMCIRELKGRLELALSDDEVKAWDRDEEFLKRVARCEVAVTSHEDGSVQKVSARPLTYRPKKQFTQQQQEGLP